MALTDIFKNSKQNKDNIKITQIKYFQRTNLHTRYNAIPKAVEIKAAGLLFGL